MSRPKIILLFFLALTVVLTGLKAYQTLNSPAQAYSFKIDLNIESGMSAERIITLLSDRNLLKSPLLFKMVLRLKGLAKKLKAGEYEFDTRMSSLEIINILEKGQVKIYPVTLPEGLDFNEVAAILASDSLVNYEEFIELGQSPQLLRKYNIPNETVEGYLYPDTYFFNKGMSTGKIMATLLDRFFEVYDARFKDRAERQGWDRDELITLASIVEKEAKKDFERPLIARVFINRLEKKMRLESCATIIYALGFHIAQLTNEDLKVDSPFNTYLHPGLPPGPISNPGAKSIEAVLNPSDGEYYYFVARNDGSHYFSKTFAEHNRAKRRIRNGNKEKK